MDSTRTVYLVRTTILVGGSLFVLAMAYGSGMRAQVKTIQRINEERKVADQNYRDAQRKLRLRLAAAEQLEARRQIDLAMDDLDHRNFGPVADRIKTAAQLLQEVQKANTVSPDMEHILGDLQQISPASESNAGTEREKLAAVAVELDSALSGFIPDFIRDSAADDTAHPIVAPTMNDVPLPPGNHIKD